MICTNQLEKGYPSRWLTHKLKSEGRRVKKSLLLACLIGTACGAGAVEVTINSSVSGNVDWNSAIWGHPAALPSNGNDYRHDGTASAILLGMGGTYGSFSGNALTLDNGVRLFNKGGGALGGLLQLNGGQWETRSLGTAVILGNIHLSASSSILLVDGSMQWNTGLSSVSNAVLSIQNWNNSRSMVVNAVDHGFFGTFVVRDSEGAAISWTIQFDQSYTNASLRIEGEKDSASYAAVYQLTGDIGFKNVAMPDGSGSLIELERGTYNGSELLDSGVSADYFNDLGGTISVGDPFLDYSDWVASWGIDIGVSSDDYDGDLLNNLGEYGMGGDPTNALDIGHIPTFENVDGTMVYIHIRRKGDSNLAYYLETTTNLIQGSWSSAGYSVVGTNEAGGTFDYVTNIVQSAEPGLFVRLIVSAYGCLAPTIPTPYTDFSVADFGATGNGVSNDTVAIQAAIDAAAVQGGSVVWFPSGVYNISSPLILSNRVSLMGRGVGEASCSSRIKATVDMPSMVQIPTNSGGHVNIENLVIDGMADEGVLVECALDLKDFLGSRVAHVVITNVSGDGIYSRWTEILSQSWVNWFVNLDIAVDGYALRLGSSDSYVDGVHVDGGLGIREELYAGNLYRNCVIENCANGISVANPAGENLRMSITECSFYNNMGYGLSLGFETQYFDSYISVDGCVFDGNGIADVYLGNCSRVALRQNDFMTGTPDYGQNIKMQGFVNYVALTDNRFPSAAQTVMGSESQSVSNQFAVVIWDGVNGAFSRDELKLLPDGGAIWNVKDFGAVGNGAADDTAALQGALDAAQSGDTVYIPIGGYKITSTLQLNGNGITVLGEGYGNVGSKIVAGNSLTAMIATPSPVSGIHMGKLNFVGNSDLGYVVDHALFFSNLTDSELDRVRVSELSGDGIVLGSGSCSNRIRNCNLSKPGGWGISLEGGDCEVDGLYCSGGYGIRISGSGGHRILNSHIDWATTAGILFEGALVGATNTLVRNCYFDINVKAIAFDFAAEQAANVAIESCLFRVNVVDIDMVNSTHVSLESNTHRERMEGTVHFQSVGTVDNLNVIGNVFEGAISIPGTNSIVYGNAMP